MGEFLELNLVMFYYFYLFMSAALFAGFISGNITLHLVNKETGEELSQDCWLYGLLCSFVSVGWLALIFLIGKGDKE